MATGRDEMLKKNQQKSKRKGLMEVLADYRREEAQKREYKPKNTPSMGKKAAEAKSNTKTAYSGKSLMPSGKKKTATQVAFSSGSFMKKKPAESTTPKQETKTDKAPARQQASTTRSNRNRGATGYGYTGGRGGKPKADTPAPNRKPKPGTGRTGAAAARAANRPKSRNSAKPMTAAERMAMRRRARRGR